MNLQEYYDRIAQVAVDTRIAFENLQNAQDKLNEALAGIKSLGKQESDMTICFTSTVSTKDCHRNILFLQLSLNMAFGIVLSPDFQEFLELPNLYIQQQDDEI